MLKPGTIVERLRKDVPPKRGTVMQPRKWHLPLPGPDWCVVRYECGGEQCCHPDDIRVVEAA